MADTDNIKGEKTKEESASKVEQSIWTVKINSQTLYKKLVDGRTILLGMTSEENQKVAEILDRTIDEISKLLEKRTTEHEYTPSKQQVTSAEASNYQAGSDEFAEEIETKDEKDEDSAEDESDESKTKITRGSGGRFVSKNAVKENLDDDEVSDEDEPKKPENKSSFFKKLIS